MQPAPYWIEEFRHRMSGLGPAPAPDQIPVSIKIRVESGCFHREHSPEAYRLIDRHLATQRLESKGVRFEEHESGPEILLYVAATTAGLSLAKSIIDLVVAIIKARSEGIKRGDGPRHPVELIVRRIDENGDYAEEKILRIPPEHEVDVNEVASKLLQPPPRAKKKRAETKKSKAR